MHDYHLLDNPWADKDKVGVMTGTTSSEMVNMTSAERVYTVSSEPSVAPDNLRTLCEVRESTDWPNWERSSACARAPAVHMMGSIALGQIFT